MPAATDIPEGLLFLPQPQVPAMATEFTPWVSLAGGLLIGAASVLLMLFHGRILGATGILSGVLFPSGAQDWAWRVMIILGMVSAPVVFLLFSGQFPDIRSVVTVPWQIAGGFLVGVGVTVGSGCTSGHGVCGMARLSPRSIAATLTFMLATAITVYIMRHVAGG